MVTEAKRRELRTMAARELRAIEGAGEGKRTLSGYAAVYDQESEVLGGYFREVIRPGAFDGVLSADVRLLLNHDPNFVLGRTKSGTLRIASDSRGLRMDADLPDTTAARDLYESLKRGDVDQMSFYFQVGTQRWTWGQNAGDIALREILTVDELWDVSVVTFPAYPGTSVSARSLGAIEPQAVLEAERARRDHEAEIRDRRLALAAAEQA